MSDMTVWKYRGSQRGCCVEMKFELDDGFTITKETLKAILNNARRQLFGDVGEDLLDSERLVSDERETEY